MKYMYLKVLVILLLTNSICIASEVLKNKSHTKMCNDLVSMNKFERIDHFNKSNIFHFWSNPEQTESKFIIDHDELIISHTNDGFKTIYAILKYSSDDEIYYLCEFENTDQLTLKASYNMGDKLFYISSSYKDSFIDAYKKENFSQDPKILINQLEKSDDIRLNALIDSPRYIEILDNIATGDEAWLKVSLVLWRYTNKWIYKKFEPTPVAEINKALGSSLDVQPKATLEVLEALNDKDALREVCTSVQHNKSSSYQETLEKRLNLLKGFTGHDLKGVASHCSTLIHKKLSLIKN